MQNKTYVKCYLSVHMSPATYLLSLMPTAKDPLPGNFFTMHSRLVSKDPPKKI